MNEITTIIWAISTFIAVYILAITAFKTLKYYCDQAELLKIIREQHDLVNKQYKFIVELQDIIDKKIDDLTKKLDA